MSDHASEAYPGSRRKPWQAALLSLLLPSLGHIYNGEAKKGILYHCLLWVIVLAFLVMGMELSLPPFNLAIPILIVSVLYLYIAFDAIRMARWQENTFRKKSYNRWYFYLIAWVISVFVAQPILNQVMRRVVIQAFKIPSGAMEGTLLNGDHILVNKFLYHFTDPTQFDVIIFRYPWDEERDFIKRVIVLPGDRVEVRDRQVYVNGGALEQEWYLHETASLGHVGFGPIVVPREGDTVEIRQDQNLYLNNERVPIPSGTFTRATTVHPWTVFKCFTGRCSRPERPCGSRSGR